MIDVNSSNRSLSGSESWLLINAENRDPKWLGDGTTSEQIIEILKRDL